METNQMISDNNKIWDLNAKAKQAWKDEGIIDGVILEPSLLRILNHIKKNQHLKPEFVEYFSLLINDGTVGPYEIIVFCMRELQWQEVADAALNEIEENDDPRIISVMNDILEVYEDEWEDEDLYEYYSKE